MSHGLPGRTSPARRGAQSAPGTATIRLVAIDLDGTLLDSRQHASARNLAAVARLLDGGVLVALATARDRASIARLVPLAAPGLHAIASGGTLVVESASGRVAWAAPMPPALTTEAVRFLRRYDHPVFLNADCDYWVDRGGDRVAMIEQRYDLRTRPFTRVSEVSLPVLRVSMAAPRPVLQRAAREARRAFGARASVSLASPDWLDVMDPRAGKGPALEWLQSRAHIRREETVAIGDYDSDLPLFALAGHRVAMANGVDAIREAATLETAGNDEDGVALALDLLVPG